MGDAPPRRRRTGPGKPVPSRISENFVGVSPCHSLETYLMYVQ
jgi:hypothetical protein